MWRKIIYILSLNNIFRIYFVVFFLLLKWSVEVFSSVKIDFKVNNFYGNKFMLYEFYLKIYNINEYYFYLIY